MRCPTEWFAATASEVVRQRLVALNADQEFAGIVMGTAYDKIECQLAARQGQMTHWAMKTWGEIMERTEARGGYHETTLLGCQFLACLDAYRWFGMPLLNGWEPAEDFLPLNRKR